VTCGFSDRVIRHVLNRSNRWLPSASGIQPFEQFSVIFNVLVIPIEPLAVLIAELYGAQLSQSPKQQSREQY